MRKFKKSLQTVLALTVALQLAACSKTVRWEEEVPLNTGETIWVKRSVDYVLKGGGSNPLDVAYRPEWNEKLEFTWGEKKYIYEGEALVMVLAISPQKQPVLVARASDKGWEGKHKYQCTSPSYVQLISDVKGHTWSWPPAIEPWLYGLPANLMLGREKPEEMKKEYLVQDRIDRDGGLDPSQKHIDPSFVFTNSCKGFKS